MSKPISLCDTAGMTNERWLECRMHGPKGDIPYTVGGSDVAAIFGVSPWTTPMELWLIKKGRMKPAAKSNSNHLMMGHLMEPIAAYWYGQKTGNTVTEDTHLYQHADHPYALANFDRRFTRKSDGEPGILECRRRYSAHFKPPAEQTGCRGASSKPVPASPLPLLQLRSGRALPAAVSGKYGGAGTRPPAAYGGGVNDVRIGAENTSENRTLSAILLGQIWRFRQPPAAGKGAGRAA